MRAPTHELTTDPVVLKILELLKIQRRTEKELITAIGLTNGQFTNWKYRGSKSYIRHIDRIADFLKVTREYLLDDMGEMLNVETMTEQEVRLLKMYRQMGTEGKECIQKMSALLIKVR